MTHLAVFDSLAKEMQDNLVDYNRRANGQTDKTILCALRLEQIVALREILRKQERHIRYMNGEKIEPENHLVEAIILGTGGLDY
jgi:hypothetical protein